MDGHRVRAITMSLPVEPCPSLLLLREGRALVLSRWDSFWGHQAPVFLLCVGGVLPLSPRCFPSQVQTQPEPSNPGPAVSTSSVALSVGPGTV